MKNILTILFIIVMMSSCWGRSTPSNSQSPQTNFVATTLPKITNEEIVDYSVGLIATILSGGDVLKHINDMGCHFDHEIFHDTTFHNTEFGSIRRKSFTYQLNQAPVIFEIVFAYADTGHENLMLYYHRTADDYLPIHQLYTQVIDRAIEEKLISPKSSRGKYYNLVNLKNWGVNIYPDDGRSDYKMIQFDAIPRRDRYDALRKKLEGAESEEKIPVMVY